MEALLMGLGGLAVIWIIKGLFTKRPEAAPAPLRKWIEHDARADAKCVRWVEHGISYLLKASPALPNSDVISQMRRAFEDNGITNPTAFGLLTPSTVERLRVRPITDLDWADVSFLFGDEVDDGPPRPSARDVTTPAPRNDPPESMRNLQHLRESGVLSDDEYQRKALQVGVAAGLVGLGFDSSDAARAADEAIARVGASASVADIMREAAKTLRRRV